MNKLIVASFALVLLSGCVEREMTIKSDPAHAQVYLEGQETGQTPCTVQFVHYGVREIALYKDGYETKKVFQEIKPPWYQIFPIDFFAEALWPFTVKDQHVLAYKLETVKPVDQDALLERAREMRKKNMEIPLK
jgi:hypothetical protein